jgi:hypothetical protein
VAVRGLPHEIVYFPPGRHAITATVDGKPKEVTVEFLADKYGRPVGLPAAGAIGALSSSFKSMPVAFQQHF